MPIVDPFNEKNCFLLNNEELEPIWRAMSGLSPFLTVYSLFIKSVDIYVPNTLRGTAQTHSTVQNAESSPRTEENFAFALLRNEDSGPNCSVILGLSLLLSFNFSKCSPNINVFPRSTGRINVNVSLKRSKSTYMLVLILVYPSLTPPLTSSLVVVPLDPVELADRRAHR